MERSGQVKFMQLSDTETVIITKLYRPEGLFEFKDEGHVPPAIPHL